MRTTHRSRRSIPARSTFAGFRFPPDVIVLAVRWYLRFGLSYRDVEELLIERGVEVDHVTVYRWVLRFTPLLAEAARPCRHRCRRSLVRGRDLCQGRRPVAVCLPGHRPVRAGHRRLRLPTARHKGSPPVLRAGDRDDEDQRRLEVITDQAPLTQPCWRSCCRRPGIAPTGTPTTGSMRPRSAEGTAGSDARPQAGPQCQGDHRRACLGAEPSTRTLRAGGRGAHQPASGGRVRRTGLGDLIRADVGLQLALGRRNATVPRIVPKGVHVDPGRRSPPRRQDRASTIRNIQPRCSSFTVLSRAPMAELLLATLAPRWRTPNRGDVRIPDTPCDDGAARSRTGRFRGYGVAVHHGSGRGSPASRPAASRPRLATRAGKGPLPALLHLLRAVLKADC